MQVGYGRTSTTEQVAGLEAQLRDLEQAGCERIFSEQVSSVDSNREQLKAALDFVRAGDTFTVTKLCRLARSIPDLVAITQKLEAKQVTLKILSLNLDTSTPTGKLMLNLIGSISQFERELMLERQREGIQKAKLEGKYKGRKPTAITQADTVKEMFNQGKGATQIAKELNIGRASVYRCLNNT
jgi:DNA invertase Pin-like site-specific DNA recombinase